MCTLVWQHDNNEPSAAHQRQMGMCYACKSLCKWVQPVWTSVFICKTYGVGVSFISVLSFFFFIFILMSTWIVLIRTSGEIWEWKKEMRCGGGDRKTHQKPGEWDVNGKHFGQRERVVIETGENWPLPPGEVTAKGEKRANVSEETCNFRYGVIISCSQWHLVTI